MNNKAGNNLYKTEFSKSLNSTYNWFEEQFRAVLLDAISEFWSLDVELKLISISENTNFLAQNDEFFVTQIRLTKELSVFVRLSKNLVKNLLETVLGKNGKVFNIEKISELEAKILTGFDNFFYKNFSSLLKPIGDIPENNNDYNECNLTFMVKSGFSTLGKIVVKIPTVAINPICIPNRESDAFSISDFQNTKTEVTLIAGYTRIKLNDLKSLEKDDIVLLEKSKSSQMILKYKNYTTKMNISLNPAIILDGYEIEDDMTENSKGEDYMGNDIYNMWDTIQVEIGAEFEKVKMSLGELKQISEGLVVDIGSVYDNKIELKVENKIVADGELVIINDRYGVKINQVYTENKRQEPLEDDVYENVPVAQEQEDEQFYQTQETQNIDDDNQEEYVSDSETDEFDLSDFDVEEDI